MEESPEGDPTTATIQYFKTPVLSYALSFILHPSSFICLFDVRWDLTA